MSKTSTSTATSSLRRAARPVLVGLGALVGALVGLVAFGAITLSTAAGFLCGVLIGPVVVIGGKLLINRKRITRQARPVAAHRSEADDAAVLERLEPLDPGPR